MRPSPAPHHPAHDTLLDVIVTIPDNEVVALSGMDVGALRARLSEAAERTLPTALKDRVGLSITVSDDKTVAHLNSRWRGKPGPTNVLSFPLQVLVPGQISASAQGTPLVLGDVILAAQTVAREAKEQKKNFCDHLTHLSVHGILHLMGWDHETDEDAQAMEARERQILKEIGIADPYADTKEVSS